MLPSSLRRAVRRPGRAIAGGALLALAGGLIVAPAVAAPAAAVAAPYTQGFDTAGGPGQAPDGWTVESTNTAGMRAGWEGWTFHTTAEVVSAFGNNGDRNSFSKAQGLVAVVQSDSNRPTTGTFDSTLWAPAYAVDPGAEAVSVSFDSHYKQGQAPQEAKLLASIDGGAPALVDAFAANRLNQTHTFTIDLPAGAQNVRFGWQYLKSSNNWFWMIDNVAIAEAAPADRTPVVTSLAKPVATPGSSTTVSLRGLRAGQQLSAVLGEGAAAVPITGIPAAAADGTVAFDVAIPAGQPQAVLPLAITGSGVTPVSIPVTVLAELPAAAATTEPQLWWDGFDGTSDAWGVEGDWAFLTRQQVVDAYGLDRRHTFTRASGVIAVAEAKNAAFDGVLTSAPVAVTGGAKLELRFDSHFRVRGGGAHTGTVAVKFDTGETVELRAITAEEESAQPRLPLSVPAAATRATVVFDYTAPAGGGSWMIDDVRLVTPLAPLADGAEPEAIVDVFSDVQGANAKLQNQVLPGFRNLPGGRADTVISNGDLTGNGTTAQYDSYFAAFNAGGGADYPTRISTIGNHEFYGGDGSATYIQRFLDRTGMRDLGVPGSASANRGLWGEVVVDGKLPVLWIGSERHEYHGGSGPFVEIWDEQFNWLRDRLDHYRDAGMPVLLSVHHIFENSVSGSYANLYKREFGDDQERMERLLAAYPNVTVMSSHTHWSPKLHDWSVEQRFVPTTSHAPTVINTAAVTTQYGPSGDWGEVGVGGADPAGLRISLYEDRLRATVYGFDTQAQPTEIKHVDIALPADDAPPAPPEVSLGVSTVAQGGEITVAGSGFLPQEALRIELRSKPVVLASPVADAQGGLSQTVRIPAETPAGQHSLVVVRADGSELSTPVVITAAEGSGGGGTDGGGSGGAGGSGGYGGQGAADRAGSNSASLARTGAQSAAPLAAGALLLAVGGGAIIVWRARRRRA
ncbi:MULTISPECIES: metallophosphoesterase [unclassified Leucobacter]|uniref:metallophosphoesterase n=1 Tax=unclassified Leucobacter TaxID=2621730 RepID=UPI003017CAE6